MEKLDDRFGGKIKFYFFWINQAHKFCVKCGEIIGLKICSKMGEQFSEEKKCEQFS